MGVGMKKNGSRVHGCETGRWAYTILFNLCKFEVFHSNKFLKDFFPYIKNILSYLVSSSEAE